MSFFASNFYVRFPHTGILYCQTARAKNSSWLTGNRYQTILQTRKISSDFLGRFLLLLDHFFLWNESQVWEI